MATISIVCNSEDTVDPTKYREIIGSLIYARPDISWVVSKLSQHLSNPKVGDLVTAKHVLRYLKGTLNYELCFRKSDKGLNLIAFSDSDWASSVEDRRSTTGYFFSLTEQGPVISWKSRKQPSVALSTCEAEYMGLAAATQESLYLTQLLNGMDKKGYNCTKIFGNNQLGPLH
ncbi:secreted RxLR effector protein 161-like [Anneissia japonica]|uniref:secreted RxLR effector protein 161-like n=1 Tax=Anneissia japonica TaxID=1529436 RepID=UPI00142593FD|nr:secreted RxLR effector protein 161-like [Anneissia japonica]